MSKVAELKVDIPLTGNGIIINVYSSIEDMSNEYYTNDYILVEAEYDGAYHKDCPIAVTYSRNSDAFNEFGTEWILTDANGNNCYVMTEPYLPHECIVTWRTPHISLSYNETNLLNTGGTIYPTANYIQEWEDSCGEGDQDSGSVVNNVDPVGTVNYSFDQEKGIYGSFSFDSNTSGVFTSNAIAIKEDESSGGVLKIGSIKVQASVHSVRGTSESVDIYQNCLRTAEYCIWILEKEGSHTYTNISLDELWCSSVSGQTYKPNKIIDSIKSYPSLEEAQNSSDGWVKVTMAYGGYQLMWSSTNYPNETAEVAAGNIIDLTDGTGKM